MKVSGFFTKRDAWYIVQRMLSTTFSETYFGALWHQNFPNVIPEGTFIDFGATLLTVDRYKALLLYLCPVA